MIIMKKINKHKHHRKIVRQNNNHNHNFLFLIIAVLFIISITLLFSHNTNIRTVTSKYSFNLNSSLFLFNFNNSEYSIHLSSISNNKANVYLQKFPNFVNPLLNISIYLNNSTEINLGSKYANLEIKLNTISINSINISLIPLNANLLINPDLQNINIVKTQQQKTSLLNTSITTINSIVVSNTINTTTSISSVNSISSTTTIPFKTLAENKTIAIKLLKSNKYYLLLQNYSNSYLDSVNRCNSSLYNLTFSTEYGKKPSGLHLYKNIINNTPLNVVSNISNKNPVFYFTYKIISKNAKIAGNILTLSVNVSSLSISNSTFSGIFKGSNYTTMYTNHLIVLSYQNSCSLYTI